MSNDDTTFVGFFSNEEPGEHEMNEEIKSFMTKYQEWLDEHEREVHDGQRCPDERANLVAYIVHRLGMNKQDWEMLLSILEFYEEQHRLLHEQGHE